MPIRTLRTSHFGVRLISMFPLDGLHVSICPSGGGREGGGQISGFKSTRSPSSCEEIMFNPFCHLDALLFQCIAIEGL